MTKAKPQHAAVLDLVPSSILRVAVYRDEWPESWESLVNKPLRAVLEACVELQTCSQVGCNCQKWHGISGPGEPEALLEVWNRGFLSASFKPCKPAEAVLFNVYLRVPTALLCTLLQAAGTNGVYFEPRGPEPRLHSQEFAVHWLPKAARQDALLVKQTHIAVVGLARVGQRYGVRCRQADAEALHKLLKPSTPYFAKDSARLYHSGPWPFGTQRQAILKALQAFGWQSKPLQPIPRPSGHGLWWSIQAAGPPPKPVLSLDIGDVIFSEVKAKAEPRALSEAPVVASQAVLKHFSVQAAETDPLQVNDPWASAAAKLPTANPPQLDVAALTRTLEARLDAQVKNQVAEASKEIRDRVDQVETKVENVATKVERQESSLREAFQQLFEQQTQRIEELLAPKRARNE